MADHEALGALPAGHWIHKALAKTKKGGLHKNLGVPAGKGIPVKKVEAAMDSIYNSLNSWSDVARDSTDRGAIALLNEYGYRPLVKVIKRSE